MVDAAQKAGLEVSLPRKFRDRSRRLLANFRAWIATCLRQGSYASQMSAHIREVNDQLLLLAAREGCRLLDFEQVFATDKGTRKPEYAMDDMSHIVRQVTKHCRRTRSANSAAPR